MKTKWWLAAICVVVAATSVRAGDGWFRYDREADAFPANQLSLDLFGTYATRDRFGADRDRWGGGAGVTYFLTRYMGLSADTYVEEWKWPYRANLSGIIRLPLQRQGAGLAPYVFGGGGRQFKYEPQWTWHAGAGLELKMNPQTGLFADGRRVFPDDTGEYYLVRAGLRFAF